MVNKKKKLANKKPPFKEKMAFEDSNRVGKSRLGIDNSIADGKSLSRTAPEVAADCSKSQKGQADKSSTPDATSGLGRSVLSPRCPYCDSEDFVKRGTRMKKGGKIQLYLCRACKRTFTPAWFKGRQHSWQVILDAMSYYNLGFSLEQTGKVMKEKFGVEIMASTLSAWLAKYGQLCAYKRMRSFGLKMYSPYEVVETCTLAHRQLYRFRYHKAKTKLIIADDFKHFKFKPMREFLDNVTAETPHQYFQEGERMSESLLKFSKTEMIVRAKKNYATALAGLVFQGVSDNKQRHEALQKFFLANDSVTVATEVPVYLRREDLEHMQTQLGFKIYTKNTPLIPARLNSRSGGKGVRGINSRGVESNSGRPAAEVAPALGEQSQKEENDDANSLREIDSGEIPRQITGHVDFLQIRNGAIHILDYKGGAAKERPIEQLTLYALALSRLTGLRLFHFKCAWFDEKDYFEFFPLHVVYKRGHGRRRIKTIEGVYNLNEKVNKIENLRPMVK